MSHPLRIQRSRIAGSRMPKDAIYVGRPTKWGNPYKASDFVGSTESAVEAFRKLCESDPETIMEIQAKLKGKQLACWCGLVDSSGRTIPCHADVLAEIENRV